VVSLPIAGGGPTIVAESPDGLDLIGLHVDATHLYFVEEPDSFSSYGPLRRAPLAAPSAIELFADSVHQAVTGNATHVFWFTTRTIVAKPKAGGAETAIYTSTTEINSFLGADDKGAYFTEVAATSEQRPRFLHVQVDGTLSVIGGISPDDIAVVGSTVYAQVANVGLFSLPAP
jgi:hypothetical protein